MSWASMSPPGVAGAVAARAGMGCWCSPLLARSRVNANALMFFMLEIAMQPLLFDIAGQLGDVPIDDRVRVPLQRRLLAAMLTITVMPGSS